MQPCVQLDPFALWLLQRAGICADAYRAAPMQRRLSACLRQLRVSSPDAARALLEANPHLLPVALNWMLLGVTSFFRDAAVFEFLQGRVLPEILRTRTGIRVFGMAVSEGQELYSVAILLAEAGVLDHSSFIGMDCRPGAIQHARAGLFSAAEVASIPAARRDRFFEPLRSGFAVCPQVRNAIQWHVADMFSYDPPPSDLILFRNVAIYVEDEPIAKVWQKLCSALAPGGCLVTGKAEKPPGTLPLCRVAPSVYFKVEEGK